MASGPSRGSRGRPGCHGLGQRRGAPHARGLFLGLKAEDFLDGGALLPDGVPPADELLDVVLGQLPGTLDAELREDGLIVHAPGEEPRPGLRPALQERLVPVGGLEERRLIDRRPERPGDDAEDRVPERDGSGRHHRLVDHVVRVAGAVLVGDAATRLDAYGDVAFEVVADGRARHLAVALLHDPARHPEVLPLREDDLREADARPLDGMVRPLLFPGEAEVALLRRRLIAEHQIADILEAPSHVARPALGRRDLHVDLRAADCLERGYLEDLGASVAVTVVVFHRFSFRVESGRAEPAPIPAPTWGFAPLTARTFWAFRPAAFYPVALGHARLNPVGSKKSSARPY